MQNPKFGVTAFTATVLTVICVAKVLLYPYLPPSDSEKLVTVDRSKAPPAAAVELAWQTEPPKAVQVAVNLRKALLWVIIDPRDPNARDLETIALRDPEVVRLINRYFIPVKLNSDDFPEAEKLIFPVSRLQSYLKPGATVLVTTPTGHLIGMIRPRGGGDRMTNPNVLAQLIGMKRRLDAHLLNPETVLELDNFARSEQEKLEGLLPAPAPDGSEQLARIQGSLNPIYGCFNSNGYGELRPAALDLMLDLGRVDEVRGAITKYCTSVGYDVLGGGVFDAIEIAGSKRTIASKSALTNAAFAETLAKLVAIGGDPTMRLLLDDTLACLSREFVDRANVFEGRVSDAQVSGLSKLFSLTGSRMDSRLSSDEVVWVRQNLLPQPPPSDYIGRLKSLELLADPALKRVREKLRPESPSIGQQTQTNRAFVVGFVCARLLRVHQLTGSQAALALFLQLDPTLRGCIQGGRVIRIANQPSSGQGWLGSYLAVLDALMQQHLVLGDRKALGAAQPILRELIADFGSAHPDWLSTTANGESPIPGLGGTAPDLSDPGYESTVATGIRVLNHYAAVVPDAALSQVLGERAERMASLVAPVTERALVSGCGVVREARSVARNTRIEVVGPVDNIPRQFPLEYVLPYSGKTPLKPGIYIVQEGARSGPFTVAAAKAKLYAP